MLRSMTGFGGAHGKARGIDYSVEARSVNNRYLKAFINLPESWGEAEVEIEKRVRSRIGRGTVNVTVRMKVTEERAAHRVNVPALKQYLDEIKALTDNDDGIRIDLGAMMLLPGVTEPPVLEDLCGAGRDDLLGLVDAALDALVAMRCDEGKTVEADLREHCGVIEENLTVVTAGAPEVVKAYHERLTARVADLTAEGRADIDEDTLAREVAIFAERCDIAEEISRLGGHVAQFRSILDGDEAAGRKLDFVAQEMLREANTIASKANDAAISRAAVEIKTAIDRIKEQVQNVE